MTKTGNENDLKWLLDYELQQSARHRRFVSMVLLSANGNSKKLEKMMKDVARDTDPLFFLPHAIAVLMGETDTRGAVKALERYREVISPAIDVRYSVASFPEDGKGPAELTRTARTRLDKANKLERGSVVAKG